MIVEKKKFSIDSFHFEDAGVSIPVEFGYETYGRLNSNDDNAVMVCHYFTGTSHAAGRYDPSDPAPGWWDRIIGPGKIIDTDRVFVLATDVFSNINHHNPMVHTTGPASINPATGEEYGMDFPMFTLKDCVRAQKMLSDHLGIKKFKLVMGPSMGGLQAFLWGRFYPEMTGAIISVVATPMIRPYGIMIPNQMGIYSIMLDPRWNKGRYYGQEPPRDGLLLAFKVLLMSTRTDHWMEEQFGRNLADPQKDPRLAFENRYLVEKGVEDIVLGRMQFFDANAYIYIARANSLYDLQEKGQSREEAWASITAPTLMIIDRSDLLFTPDQAQQATKHMPDADVFYYDSGNGHLSCLFDIHLFEDAIAKFINKKELVTR